jgi:hypothetical protein
MLRLALALFAALLLTACGGSSKKTNDTSQELGPGDSDTGGTAPDEFDDIDDEAGDTMPDDFGDGAVDDM